MTSHLIVWHIQDFSSAFISALSVLNQALCLFVCLAFATSSGGAAQQIVAAAE
jgi:hypothetical protein